MSCKLRMGMVGGGKDAFIGAVHRMAARLDGQIELVCGAFSSDAEKSRASGLELGLSPDRVYGSYEDMFAKESAMSTCHRMEFVSIVTPNHMHFPIAVRALGSGFHVVCDKPMTTTLDEARTLANKVDETGLLFCLTHNYTGYPMVKEARDLVASGSMGAVRRVVVEYSQGWMATLLEATGQKQAEWRTDPARSGASYIMGDLGTHCANLAEFVTGLKIEQVSADLKTFLPGRRLDDDGSVMLRFDNGARGVLWASAIAVGEENNLGIRVYGEKGSLEWHQQEPNTLIVRWLDRPSEVRRTGAAFVGAGATACTRLPSGHPEGYIEGLANIYRNFALALGRTPSGDNGTPAEFPDVHDGVRGMAFIEAAVQSSKSDQKWIRVG